MYALIVEWPSIQTANTYLILLSITPCTADIRILCQKLGYIGHNRLLIWLVHINICKNKAQLCELLHALAAYQHKFWEVAAVCQAHVLSQEEKFSLDDTG